MDVTNFLKTLENIFSVAVSPVKAETFATISNNPKLLDIQTSLSIVLQAYVSFFMYNEAKILRLFFSLEVILINRMIFNLSYAANYREESMFRSQTGLEPPTFATNAVLGNIGAPLRTLTNDDQEDGLEPGLGELSLEGTVATESKA